MIYRELTEAVTSGRPVRVGRSGYICNVCGEVWDETLLNESLSHSERRAFFEGKGCPVCQGEPTEELLEKTGEREGQ